MALTNNRKTTIEVNVLSDTRLIEAHLATGTVAYPGMLMQFLEEDNQLKLRPRPDGAGVGNKAVPLLVCVENLEEGKLITDSYSNGEKTYARHFRSGDIFLGKFAILQVLAVGGYAAMPIGGINDGLFEASTTSDESIAVCYKAGDSSVDDLIYLYAK